MTIKLLAAVAMLALPAPAMAAHVAVNGSFEDGGFTGWTQFGDTSFTNVFLGASIELPTDGNYQARFGPVDGIGGISQLFASAGTYTVSFDLANNEGSYSSVDFGGITLLSNVANSLFTNYSFTVSVGTNSVLSFAFFNNPDYYRLDNVVVDLTSGSVPEPASWAMLIAGFGLTGAAMRRRRIALAA